MAWNGPINGDWSKVNFNAAPWNNDVCTLMHEEVLFVIESLPSIEEEFLPDVNMVVSKFNALTNWEKCINGDTYAVIKGYDPEIHTLGIDSNGIVMEETPVEVGEI